MSSQPALVTVRIKADVAKRLEKLAESMERSKSYLAAEAIEEYLDIHEWQIQAIHKGLEEIKQGKTIPFEKVKKYWKKQIEN